MWLVAARATRCIRGLQCSSSGCALKVSFHSGKQRTGRINYQHFVASRRWASTSFAHYGDQDTGADGPLGGAWSRLGLLPSVAKALESELKLDSPSEIQEKAIPAILAGEDVMFAAETGSGKTLGYLAPVFSMLKAEEELVQVDRVERRPRAVVLVPTRELGSQVLSVAKRLAKSSAKLTCRAIIGGSDGIGKQRRAFRNSAVDLVVASPSRFVKMWHNKELFISRVSHVVVDEADTILSQGWGPELREILKATILFKPQRNTTQRRAQLVLTSATLTPAVREAFAGGARRGGADNVSRRELWSFVPPVRIVQSTSLHRTVPSVRTVSISTIGKDKMRILLDQLQSYYKGRPAAGGDKTMVFCNTIASCRAADFAIRDEFDDVLCYHGDMNQAEREASIAVFRNASHGILVCTDLAARGLDLPAVGHVLNFDFPRNPIDYLHRAGRTARFGNAGRVTSLVAKRDRVLAAAIDRAIAANQPLDALTGNKKDYLPGGRLASHQGNSIRGAARLELSKANKFPRQATKRHVQRPRAVVGVARKSKSPS